MGFFCPCAILTAQTHPDSYCKVLSSLKDFGKLIYKKAYNKGDVKPWSVFSLAIFLLFFFNYRNPTKPGSHGSLTGPKD